MSKRKGEPLDNDQDKRQKILDKKLPDININFKLTEKTKIIAAAFNFLWVMVPPEIRGPLYFAN